MRHLPVRHKTPQRVSSGKKNALLFGLASFYGHEMRMSILRRQSVHTPKDPFQSSLSVVIRLRLRWPRYASLSGRQDVYYYATRVHHWCLALIASPSLAAPSEHIHHPTRGSARGLLTARIVVVSISKSLVLLQHLAALCTTEASAVEALRIREASLVEGSTGLGILGPLDID